VNILIQIISHIFIIKTKNKIEYQYAILFLYYFVKWLIF